MNYPQSKSSVVLLLIAALVTLTPGLTRSLAPQTRAAEPMVTKTADPRDEYFLSPRYATDSAAAATALATGQKTSAGNIAWTADDGTEGRLETIAEQLRAESGFAVGIVSTVPFNHATPAAFVAHNVQRGNTAEIAHEIIFETVPEVVIGAGYHSGYFPASNPNYQALGNEQTPYTHVVERTEGMDGGTTLQETANAVSLARGERLFGLFGTTEGHFAYHHVADTPGQPTVTQGASEDPSLAHASLAAMTVLSQDDDGFFLMVEQGDIDWSNHQNNFTTMIGGIWDLDGAVQAVESFVAAPGGPSWSDTLLVLTADHGNSYLRLPVTLPAGDLPRQLHESTWTYPDEDVIYHTTSHTNELVTLWARGQGNELFEEYTNSWYPDTRIVDNTQIYEVLRQAVSEQGVRHLILFVGDGMQLAHEVAGSRYLYGKDMALAWHRWSRQSDSWRGFATTWDVTTYNKYAADAGAQTYTPATFDPLLGYNGNRGGWAPYPLVSSEHAAATIYLPIIR